MLAKAQWSQIIILYFMGFYSLCAEHNLLLNQANDNKCITVQAVVLPRIAQQIHLPFYPNSRQLLSIPTCETIVSEHLLRACPQKGCPAVPEMQSALSRACHVNIFSMRTLNATQTHNVILRIWYSLPVVRQVQENKSRSKGGRKSPTVTHRVVNRIQEALCFMGVFPLIKISLPIESDREVSCLQAGMMWQQAMASMST